MGLIVTALVGFVVGLVARALLPGRQKLGLILTTLLGIAGAFVAGYVGQAMGWYQVGQAAGFIASVVGAMALLVVVGLLRRG